MSKATEVTEPTGAAPEPPPSDQYDIYCGSLTITVFVRANGSLFIMATARGLSADLRVPAEQVAAFARAVSTPYSGGTAR